MGGDRTTPNGSNCDAGTGEKRREGVFLFEVRPVHPRARCAIDRILDGVQSYKLAAVESHVVG